MIPGMLQKETQISHKKLVEDQSHHNKIDGEVDKIDTDELMMATIQAANGVTDNLTYYNVGLDELNDNWQELKDKYNITARNIHVTGNGDYVGGIVGNIQMDSSIKVLEAYISYCVVLADLGDKDGTDSGGCHGGIVGRIKNDKTAYYLDINNSVDVFFYINILINMKKHTFVIYKEG